MHPKQQQLATRGSLAPTHALAELAASRGEEPGGAAVINQ